MTGDENIKENLKYLDTILDSLVNNTHTYSTSFSNLYKIITDRDLDEDIKQHSQGLLVLLNESDNIFKGKITVNDNAKAAGTKLVEALYYLSNEGYVRLDNEFNIVITFKGIIQHSSTFLEVHNKNKSDRLLNKFNIFITIIIATLTLIAGLIINK